MKGNLGNRYHTIDSLRGIAALSVVFFHLYGALKDDVAIWFPAIFDWILLKGFIGVPVFFVLSGFVISLSVGKARVTPKFIANFAFRRSLRLDPPYWVAIFIALVLMFFKTSFLGLTSELPSSTNIIAHFLYLQDLLNFNPKISVVYWTLCLEIQFYLVFVISISISQFKCFKGGENLLRLFILIGLGCGSLLIDQKFIILDLSGFFLQYWHYFLIGVLAQLGLAHGKPYQLLFLAWITVECILLVGFNFKNYIFAALITGGFIFVAGYRNKLSEYLNNAVLQFFGKISYSLYLLHADIGWKAISVGKKLLGSEIGVFEFIVLFALGLFASILSAYALYHFVERPFVKIGKKFKIKRKNQVGQTIMS